MAARVVRDPAGGSKSLPDGSVHEGRGTVQLHDVTGKVQRARLIIAVQSATCELPPWDAHFKFKNESIREQKQARFRVNGIPRSGVKYPLFLGHRITSS